MLIISGSLPRMCNVAHPDLFQSRNRDAYHFRFQTFLPGRLAKFSFNLAIEMLIISGSKICVCNSERHADVSISQSRCLSFQVNLSSSTVPAPFSSFNLAIEMLIISGRRAGLKVLVPTLSFNLAIEMLIISGCGEGARGTVLDRVSILQSRCLSFQGEGPSSH